MGQGIEQPLGSRAGVGNDVGTALMKFQKKKCIDKNFTNPKVPHVLKKR